MTSLDFPTRTLSQSRPYVTTVLAMSVDGKISDAHRTAARFPSPADKQHLERCLATADATLFGATTLRAYGTTALIKDGALLETRRTPQPIHIVCSTSGQLASTMPFFEQPIPRWLLTTVVGATHWQGTQQFEKVWVGPMAAGMTGSGACFDWPAVFTELKNLNIHRLLVMGGGQLVAALMDHDLIDELWLTICPVVIGGNQAPTPCDGDGFSLSNAPRFSLISHQSIGDEVFLNYRRLR